MEKEAQKAAALADAVKAEVAKADAEVARIRAIPPPGLNRRNPHRFVGKLLGATMWFFVSLPGHPSWNHISDLVRKLFYRAKQDGTKTRPTETTRTNLFPTGPVMLGWRHPWEH